jgi:hypothetical protein
MVILGICKTALMGALVGLLLMSVLIGGCSNAGDDKTPPARVSKVFYARSESPGGVFRMYTLSDSAAINRLRDAIRDDVMAKRPGSFGVKLSEDHVVLFYTKENSLVFECQLLGDDYLIIDGDRYYGKATLACLQDLMQNVFTPATESDMKGLRQLERYIRRPATSRPTPSQ